jgi:hypothetical protein
MPTSQVKPFDIPKSQVLERRMRRVAADKGASGVDEETLGIAHQMGH